MAEDRWLYWQRDPGHGPTSARVLALAIITVVIVLLWAGPRSSAQEPASRAPSPCVELARLRAAGVDHGPEFWAAKGGCPSSYKTSP